MRQEIGIELSRRFYESLVAPVLRQQFPDLRHAAARIGLGSEVLGYDTELSADHDYGPCVQLFLAEADFPDRACEVMGVLDRALPDTFEGWTVRYPTYVRPPAANAQPGMLGSDHGAELYTVSAWCERFLGRQVDSELTAREWLSYSEHLFLMVTAGPVFRDDLGELTALRDRLAYFPRDVWLYKLVAQWNRISEERAFVGRAGDVGDDIGSRLIAARMVGNIMRLAMLIERRYAPYPKWFGTAFSRLDCASELMPMLERILSAEHWQEREARIADACRFVAELQIARGIPGAIAPIEASIHSRPYRFVDSIKIGEAVRAAIGDDDLRQLPEFGAADQFISSSFVLAVPDYAKAAVSGLLEGNLGQAGVGGHRVLGE